MEKYVVDNYLKSNITPRARLHQSSTGQTIVYNYIACLNLGLLLVLERGTKSLSNGHFIRTTRKRKINCSAWKTFKIVSKRRLSYTDTLVFGSI